MELIEIKLILKYIFFLVCCYYSGGKFCIGVEDAKGGFRSDWSWGGLGVTTRLTSGYIMHKLCNDTIRSHVLSSAKFGFIFMAKGVGTVSMPSRPLHSNTFLA